MPQTPFNYREAFRIDQWYKITSLVEKCRKNGIKFLVVFSAKQVALHVIFQLALVSFLNSFCYSYHEWRLSDCFGWWERDFSSLKFYRSKSKQRLKQNWKCSHSRCGERTRHSTLSFSTKSCQGKWRQLLMRKGVTPNN